VGQFGVSASTFQIGTGLYLIVVAMLASTVGGYIAGRLRTKWVDVHTHEVFFRDTAHGFWHGDSPPNSALRFWLRRLATLLEAHQQPNQRDPAVR
jgi:hypothetical protein